MNSQSTPNEAGVARFTEDDREPARKYRLLLYCQIAEDHVSFDYIAQAWWIRNDPDTTASEDEKRVSRFLECLARTKFSTRHHGIEKDCWIQRPWAACALTGDAWVHSVLNTTDYELVALEGRIHQLCRDAHRTFEPAARRHRRRHDSSAVGNVGETTPVPASAVPGRDGVNKAWQDLT